MFVFTCIAQFISKNLDNLPILKEKPKQQSVTLSTLRTKGEIAFVSKSSGGDSMYELIKKEGMNPL